MYLTISKIMAFLALTLACVEKSPSDKTVNDEMGAPESQDGQNLAEAKVSIEAQLKAAKSLLEMAVVGTVAGQYQSVVVEALRAAVEVAETEKGTADVGRLKVLLANLNRAIAGFIPLTMTADGEIVQPEPVAVPVETVGVVEVSSSLATLIARAQLAVDFELGLPASIVADLTMIIDAAEKAKPSMFATYQAQLYASLERVKFFKSLKVETFKNQLDSLKNICNTLQIGKGCASKGIFATGLPSLVAELKSLHEIATEMLAIAESGARVDRKRWDSVAAELVGLSAGFDEEQASLFVNRQSVMAVLGFNLASIDKGKTAAQRLVFPQASDHVAQGRVKFVTDVGNLCLEKAFAKGDPFVRLGPCHFESSMVWTYSFSGRLCNDGFCLSYNRKGNDVFILDAYSESSAKQLVTFVGTTRNSTVLKVDGRSMGKGAGAAGSRIFYRPEVSEGLWSFEPVSNMEAGDRTQSNLAKVDALAKKCINCFGVMGKGADNGYVEGGNRLNNIIALAETNPEELRQSGGDMGPSIDAVGRTWVVRGELRIGKDRCLSFKRQKVGEPMVSDVCRFDRGHFNFYPDGVIKTENDKYCLGLKTLARDSYDVQGDAKNVSILSLQECSGSDNANKYSFEFEKAAEGGKSRLKIQGQYLNLVNWYSQSAEIVLAPTALPVWLKVYEGSGPLIYGAAKKRGRGGWNGELADSVLDNNYDPEVSRISGLNCRRGRRLDRLVVDYSFSYGSRDEAVIWGGGGGNPCPTQLGNLTLGANEKITRVKICDYGWQAQRVNHHLGTHMRVSSIQFQVDGDRWLGEQGRVDNHGGCTEYGGDDHRLVGFYGRESREVFALMPIFIKD